MVELVCDGGGVTRIGENNLFLIGAHQVTGSAALVIWISLALMSPARRLSFRRRCAWLVSSAVLAAVLFSGGRDINLAGPSLRIDPGSFRETFVGLKGWVPAVVLVCI